MALPKPGDDGSSTSQSVTPSPTVLRPKRRKNLTPADEVIQLAGEQLRSIRPDDEFDAYGKYVAHKLRSLKGSQAIFARKLINEAIFEGELEALTKDFKVMATQPHRSFESRDYQQFNPQVYHQQPYTSPSIPPMPDHHFSHSHITNHLQHNSLSSTSCNNIVLPNPATLYSKPFNNESTKTSNMTLPYAPTKNPEHLFTEQPKTQQPKSQQLDSQEPTNSIAKLISGNINSSQSTDNNVSAFYSNFSV